MMRTARIKFTKRCIQACRLNYRYPAFSSYIPKPTWSIRELPLERNDHGPGQESLQQQQQQRPDIATPVIQDVELDILAKRCLLDLDHLSKIEREELKVELGNIMTCISLVSRQGTPTVGASSVSAVDSCISTATRDNNDSDDDSGHHVGILHNATEEEMYDLPRGFLDKNCPVRNEIAELKAWEMSGDKEDSEFIFKHLSSSKMVTTATVGTKQIKENGTNNDNQHDNYFVIDEIEPQRPQEK
mmetsp:Transcript_15972/g.30119  ORF Transcript_15972/g.30119 Transcript_15972/m.30119 type:complete len:244 (+) Transcript_15972:87-818(+)